MRRGKKFIHVDMDCFYAAVEMRDNPQYKALPIAVGGRPDERGVISTSNYIARNFGVKSAVATAHALKLCPKLVILPARISYYKTISLQIHEIFSRYTDLIEPISLDEAYLDVTSCPEFSGSATLIAQNIRNTIEKELGLTASAGVAPMMFLAKIASEINKPNGQFVIKPNEALGFIEELQLRKIPGIGKVTSEKLKQHGLITCKDVKNSNLQFLVKNFGKLGFSIWDKAHGIEHREVIADRIRKSISVERTLNSDVFEWSEYEHFLILLYKELDARVRRNNALNAISKLTVKVKFSDFKQTTLETSMKALDYDVYQMLSKRIWTERRDKRGVRTIGIGIVLRLKEDEISHQLPLTLA